MMTTRADIEAAVDFLQWWRPGGPWVLTSIAVDRRALDTETFDATRLDAMRDWLTRCGERKWNCYYHVNPTRAPLSKKAEAKDIAALDWLHVDIDPQAGREIDSERTSILQMLQDPDNGMPPPTAIIFSGGGYQAYWRLREPLALDGTQEAADDAKRYNLQVELLLGGDNCHNVDRIMRLPGTVNWPNAKKVEKGQTPVRAAVLEKFDDRVYDLAQFTRAPKVQDALSESGGGTEATAVRVSGNVARNVDLAELPKGLAPRARVAIVQGKDPEQTLSGNDQSRSAWLFYVVCALVRAEVDDDTIYAIITDPSYVISASVLDKGNSQQVHRYAIRQIKKAKEAVIAPELAEMNERYALIESVGGKCRIAKESWNQSFGRHEVEFLLVDGFKLCFGNAFVTVKTGRKDGNGNPILKDEPLGKWWLSHPERRTYENVVFHPGGEFPKSLNLWRGFACDAIPGDCSLYLSHLRDVICKGNEQDYRYLVGWMAYGVQHPDEPGHTAVALRGKQGTGKGTVAKHYGALWGVHYKHVTNADHITGQFNAMMQDASFVFADECFRKDEKHVSALKTLITEDTFRAEAKGLDNIEVRNCARIMLATNKDWAVHASLDDRRFFILEVSDNHRKDVAHFEAIDAQMRSGGYEALLHHLLTMDLSEFNVRDAPATEELRVQQQHSMSDVEAFWFTCLDEGRLMPGHSEWTGEAITDQFADRFLRDYSTDKKLNLHRAKMRLGNLFKRLLGGGLLKRRRRGHTVTWEDGRGKQHELPDPIVWIFPDLQTCRDAWTREFQTSHEWPEDVVDGEDPI